MSRNLIPMRTYIEDKWFLENTGSVSLGRALDETPISNFERHWLPIPIQIYVAVHELADDPKRRICGDPYRAFADAIGYFPAEQELPDGHNWSMSKILRTVCDDTIGFQQMFIFSDINAHQFSYFFLQKYNQVSLSEWLYLQLTLRQPDCGINVTDHIIDPYKTGDYERPTFYGNRDDEVYSDLILDWKRVLGFFKCHNKFVSSVKRLGDKIMSRSNVLDLINYEMKTYNELNVQNALSEYQQGKVNMVGLRT